MRPYTLPAKNAEISLGIWMGLRLLDHVVVHHSHVLHFHILTLCQLVGNFEIPLCADSTRWTIILQSRQKQISRPSATVRFARLIKFQSVLNLQCIIDFYA